MAISKKAKIDVDRIAELANLSLSQKEKFDFQKQLEEILDYISKLDEVDTQNLEPIDHITGLQNVVREDFTAPSLNQQEALKNAPKTHSGFFEVDAIFDEN